jgi:hypothetical protein
LNVKINKPGYNSQCQEIWYCVEKKSVFTYTGSGKGLYWTKISGEFQLMSHFQKYLPLVVGLFCLWLVVVVILSFSISKNQGHLIYAVDDAYIHMAMAKHFSQNGVWGVTKQNFSSTSSSLLWTLILSFFYAIFGVSEMTPFILNFALATLLVLFFYYILEKLPVNSGVRALLMIIFIVGIPLPYLVFCGLEHVLQIFLDLLFCYVAVKIVFSESGVKIRENSTKVLWLCLLAFLVSLVRYEGIFLVFMVSLLLLLKRNIFKSIFCGVAGLFPIVIYGLISVSQGWYFFPSSIILKGRRPDFSSLKGILEFIYSGFRQLIYNIHIFMILVVILLLLWFFFRKKNFFRSVPIVLGFIFLGTVLIHMLLARSGWYLNIMAFIRYDAYLLALGFFIIVLIWINISRENQVKTRLSLIQKSLFFLIGCLITLPVLERGIIANLNVAQATANIYSQQYQMGQFLKKYYQNESVVVNDIGAINFITDIRCLDLWGLANKEIAKFILEGRYSSAEVESFVRSGQGRIAIIYDNYLNISGGIPRDWILVARWKILNNVICSFDTVSFYALNKNEIPYLIYALKKYSSRLPAEVVISGLVPKR